MSKKIFKALLAAVVSMSALFANVSVNVQAATSETSDSITYTDEIPGFNATSYETLKTGYQLNNNGGNNHSVSSVKSKEFVMEVDITIVEGNSASILFGAEGSTVDTLGKLFGLEYSKTGNNITIKLFQDGAGSIGDGIIPAGTVVTSITDASAPIKAKVSYTETNGLEIWANGVKADFTFAKDFDSAYQGGYIGFMSWNTTAKYENFTLSVPATTYEDELPEYAGTNVTDLETGYQLTNTGGNNHSVSSIKTKEFTMQSDLTFVEGSKASFVFGAESSSYTNLSNGSKFFGLEFFRNTEKDELQIKLFHEYGLWDGVIPYTTAISNIGDKTTFAIKVAYDEENSLRIWVDENEVEYTFAKDFEGTYTGGYIGFLTFQTTAKFENIVLTPEGTTVYENELPNYEGRKVETLIAGYQMNNNNNNNYGTSTVTSKEFTYETTIEYNSGSCASIVFGAQSDKYSDLGSSVTFFGLEFYKDASNNIYTKLFQDGPGVRGNEFISRGDAVGTATDNKIKVKVSYTNENGLEYWVNGVKANPTIRSDFESSYVGGYFGFLTYAAEVQFTDISLTTYAEENGYFNTNLDNLHGLNGTWKITTDGLYSSGGGDNFALSDTNVSNFIYEADVTFADANGAASLVFRSTDSPSSGSYVANISRKENVMRIFKFPGGVNVGSAPLSENKDTYKMRVEAIGNSLKFYVDDQLVVAGNDDVYTSGKLGILTWNTTVTYQNVLYKEVSAEDLPTLTDLTVTGEGVTFTPAFSETTASYEAFLPAGVNQMSVTATAAEGSELSYSIVSSGGVEYDNGSLTSGEAKVVTPAYGTSKMAINVTKGDITSSIIINITKKSDASDMAEEDHRPQLHFSPEINFMNDPNGLVYDPSNNTWHMFFQYSPQLPQMGSQTWGHAVSDDLVNWVELPVAIEMDKFGAIFSGSCVVDEDNTSGFFDDVEEGSGQSKLVAIYTNAGSYGMVQNIAYSTDHGVTWTKYETSDGQAVIPDTYHDGFRDPKVFKVEEDGPWYMIVAGGRARIFVSENLKEWTLVQELYYADGSELHSECPGLYPLEVLDKDGNATGTTKWVYNASSEFYVIGDLVKNSDGYYTFVAETNRVSSQTGGSSNAYAAQTYYNDGSGKNRIMTVHWMQDYSAPNYIATKRWNGVQSFPLETTLKQLEDGSYLICQTPVEEVEALRAGVLYETSNATVNAEDENILAGVTAQVYEVEAVFDMNKTTATSFGFELRTGSGEKTVYYYNATSKKMILDKSASSNTGYDNHVLSWTLTPTSDGKIKLRAIVDNSVIETFGNDGDAHLIDMFMPSSTSVGMAFFANGGSVAIDELTVYDMKSIYTRQSISENTTKTYVTLAADNYVDTAEPFTVTAAVYPMNGEFEIEWDYDKDALTLVDMSDTTITLIPKENGTYTIGATINGVEESVTVNAITREFITNLVDWSAVNGAWDITDRGVLGSNKGSGDVFYISDTYLAKDQEFVYEADMYLESGRAAGLLFGVKDPENPAGHWYCLNSDTEENGGHFKLFKNTGNQDWASTAEYGSFAETTKYRLRVAYDGEGTFTYYASPYGSSDTFYELGSYTDTTYNGGYFGVMTFMSNTSFNNVMLYTDGTVSTYEEIKDITVEEGTTVEELEVLLPDTVRITLTDGIKRDVAVEWPVEDVDLNKAGTYTLTVTIDGLEVSVDVIVTKATTTPTPETPDTNTTPETGDSTNVAGLLAMLLASAYVITRKRKA